MAEDPHSYDVVTLLLYELLSMRAALASKIIFVRMPMTEGDQIQIMAWHTGFTNYGTYRMIPWNPYAWTWGSPGRAVHEG